MSLPARRTPCGFIALVVVLTLTPLVTHAGPQGKKFPKCCVWRVTNVRAPFYLVGSIHALSKKDYPLPKPYEIALKDSRRLLFEFDPTRHAEFEKKFEAAAKYPRGQDIRSKISPQLLAWLRKNMFTIVLNGRAGSDRLGSFDNQLCYKPWWIAQHLAAPAAYSKTSASHGLDNYFVDHAMRTGTEIGGLESVNEHVAVMGGLSDRDGEFILQDALTQPDNGEKDSARMYKAWRKGNTDALWTGDAHLRARAPRIAARFVDDRNVKWVPRIEAELKTGKPTAIVAGALHFSGPHSVIALLQQRGYVIEQL
jgi:uncharacterized protein